MIETVTATDMGSYLLVVSSGTIETVEDLIELQSRIAEEIAKHDNWSKIVDDERNVFHQEDFPAVLDYFQKRIDKYPAEYRQVRAATVVNAESKRIGEFWETYLWNRGINWPVFTELEQAVTFVTSE